MTRLTPRTNGLVQGFAAASLSTNTSPTENPTSPPNSNKIPQANDNTRSPALEAITPPRPKYTDIGTPSKPLKTTPTSQQQKESEKQSTPRSTRESAPSPPSITRTTSDRAPVSMLPPIPPNDPLILKISHHLLIDYATAASFHRAIISSSDTGITPGSSQYFEYVATLRPPKHPLLIYPQHDRNYI